MSEANNKTLTTYNQEVQSYIDGTAQTTSGFQKQWLDFIFKDVPKDAAILEIGSAFGRDARYLIDQGFSPELTDASLGFVEYLRENGFEATVLDIVNQVPEKKYDIILACAVFLHFTDEDFQKAVKNVRQALNENGRFAFSIKQGEGEKWSDTKMGAPRYFNYYQPEKLEQKLGEAGVRVVDIQSYEQKWLHVVSVRNE